MGPAGSHRRICKPCGVDHLSGRCARRVEESLVVWTDRQVDTVNVFPSSQLSKQINFLSYFLKINKSLSESCSYAKSENFL